MDTSKINSKASLLKTHSAVITLSPEPGLLERKDQAKEQLAAYKGFTR